MSLSLFKMNGEPSLFTNLPIETLWHGSKTKEGGLLDQYEAYLHPCKPKILTDVPIYTNRQLSVQKYIHRLNLHLILCNEDSFKDCSECRTRWNDVDELDGYPVESMYQQF